MLRCRHQSLRDNACCTIVYAERKRGSMKYVIVRFTDDSMAVMGQAGIAYGNEAYLRGYLIGEGLSEFQVNSLFADMDNELDKCTQRERQELSL